MKPQIVGETTAQVNFFFLNGVVQQLPSLWDYWLLSKQIIKHDNKLLEKILKEEWFSVKKKLQYISITMSPTIDINET